MLETKCVGEKFDMLITDFEYFKTVTNITLNVYRPVDTLNQWGKCFNYLINQRPSFENHIESASWR